MEKIKEIFNDVVTYCKNEPFHFAILAGLAAFIVVMLIVIAVVAKKRATAKANEKQSVSQIETPISVKEESAALKQEQAATETKEVAKEATKAQEPSTVTETAKATIDENATAGEKAESVVEPTETKPVVIPEEKIVPKKEGTVQQIPAPSISNETATKTQKDTPKGKPVKTEETREVLQQESTPTTYEEDESEETARYSGKWIICRVVTEEENEEEEMYFFELRASNGEKLLSSEEYTTYNGAIRGIQTHKSNILNNNFRITLSKKGDYIFKLLNGKGMLLCLGEHYATKTRCESAIESTKRFARTAFVDENIQDHVVKIPVEDDSSIAPLQDGYNGKWVIDSRVSAEGERVFFFELFANNGERLLSSEEYTTYIGAVNGIHTHKTNIQKGNFRISLTKHGDYIYKLLNGNNQLLCLGEHYKTKRRCQNAVESVKRFASHSPILTDPSLPKA